jgi:hypothetical protein
MTNTTTSLPVYSQVWNAVKRFPQVIATGSTHPPRNSGVAAAAFLSGGIGAALMMLTHHYSDTHKEFETFLHKTIGAWMPGAVNTDTMWGNIGSYAGKETVLLLGWLMSWLILHWVWRHQSIAPRVMFLGFLGLYTIAAAMSWHPLFPYLPLQ